MRAQASRLPKFPSSKIQVVMKIDDEAFTTAAIKLSEAQSLSTSTPSKVAPSEKFYSSFVLRVSNALKCFIRS